MIDHVLFCARRHIPKGWTAWIWAALLGLTSTHAHSADPTAHQPGSVTPTHSAPQGDTPSDPPITPPADHSASGTPVTAPPAAQSTPPSQAWQRLSKRQKQALAPLANSWDTLTPVQRQKWLTLSRGFLRLSDEEQITLHTRMSDWAALSPKQRNQARFHFKSAQKLPIDDKRAQWEAYQQLSEQDKRLLSSGPRPPVKSTARSTRPPSPRLISPPALPNHGERAISQVAPAQATNPQTLLPEKTDTKKGARQ